MVRSVFRLLLVLPVAFAAYWCASPIGTVRGQSETPAGLFVADFSVNDGSASGELHELDPLTLADATVGAGSATPAAVAVPATPGGSFVYREWVGSADGTTAVTIEWPRENPIRRIVTVRRGIDGSAVSRFDLPGSLGLAIPFGQLGTTFLSADGSRLALVSEDASATPPAG